MQEIFETSKLIKFNKEPKINLIQTMEESSESNFTDSSDDHEKSQINNNFNNNNSPYEI